MEVKRPSDARWRQRQQLCAKSIVELERLCTPRRTINCGSVYFAEASVEIDPAVVSPLLRLPIQVEQVPDCASVGLDGGV